jgi:hypothetical protein
MLEAIPQSHSSSFKNSMGIQLSGRQKMVFPSNSKEDRIRVEDTNPLLPSAILRLPAY